MKLKKLTLVTLLIFAMSTFVVGCSDEEEKETTTKEEITTAAQETTTKVVETTTEEPTTKEVDTTTKAPEEEYLRKGFIVGIETFDYFDGLILEKGDLIYINELYPGESNDYNGVRGSHAVALLRTFKMREEENALNSKYREEGSDGAEIPHSANYCIEYSGEKIQFVFVKKDSEHAWFDVVMLKK